METRSFRSFFIFLMISLVLMLSMYLFQYLNNKTPEPKIFVNMIKLSQFQQYFYNRSNQLVDIRKQYLKNYTNYYDTIKKQVHILTIESLSTSSSLCMVINALELSDKDITVLKNEQAKMQSYIKKQIFYFFDRKILQKFVKSITLNKRNLKIKAVTIDSSYKFISQSIKDSCSSFLITRLEHIMISIPQIPEQQIKDSCYVIPPLQNQTLATRINQTSLYDLQDSEISSCIFIFDPKFLNIITPLNFAIQNVYTFTHLLINPIIAYVSGSNAFKTQSPIHYLSRIPKNQKKLKFQRLQTNRENFCFVNYPYNLKYNNLSDFSNYLSAFQAQKLINKNISIITSLVYQKPSDITPFIKLALSLSQSLPIRIKIRYQRIQTSLQVYQAAFVYCPSSSTIISSRHNIQLRLSDIFLQNSQGLCVDKVDANEKTPYYLIPAKLYDSSENIITLRDYKFFQHLRKGTRFNKHFRYVQFFCEQAIRAINITFLKSYQTNFYASEQSFMLLIAQACKTHFSVSKTPLFKVNYQRKPSRIQYQQQMSLKERLYNRQIRNNHRIQPIQYNPLINRAFKRNAPQLIPRIIHQIYLSQEPISQIRDYVRMNLLSKHPDFKYCLWTWEDVTKQNFPMTFDMIQIIKKYDQHSQINFKAIIADLMRIQILYLFGGIYIDMKFQAKKSLVPFLKYQRLFLYTAYWQLDLQHQMVTGALNGILMTVPNSIHYRLILQKFYRPQFFQDYFSENPSFTMVLCSGGLVLRSAFSNQQLIQETCWGQDLMKKISPEGPCHNLVSFDEGKKYHIVNHQLMIGSEQEKAKKIKYLTMPCDYDQDKYLEMYFQLASTYLKAKEQFS